MHVLFHSFIHIDFIYLIVHIDIIDFDDLQSTDYELVDCVALVKSTLEFDLFVHCNFTAKPHKYPFVAGDYSTKLFYAEIRGDINGQINASKYSILHGQNS